MSLRMRGTLPSNSPRSYPSHLSWKSLCAAVQKKSPRGRFTWTTFGASLSSSSESLESPAGELAAGAGVATGSQPASPRQRRPEAREKSNEAVSPSSASTLAGVGSDASGEIECERVGVKNGRGGAPSALWCG